MSNVSFLGWKSRLHKSHFVQIQVVTSSAPAIQYDRIYALDEYGVVWFFERDVWRPLTIRRDTAMIDAMCETIEREEAEDQSQEHI